MDLDIVADEEDPHAIVTVFDRADVVLSRARVSASFKLTTESARQWLKDGGLEIAGGL